VLQHLERLVEKSLVVVDAQGAEVRYGMLETIREYGLERLAEAGETEEVRARHTAYFVELGERAKREIVGPRQREWFARLAADLDNFRLALVRSVREGRDPEAGLRLCAALDRLWCLHGHVREGRQWVGEALARTANAEDAPPAIVARALEAAGMLENAVGDHRSRRMYAERVLEIWRALGDPLGEARAIHNVGEALLFEGDYVRGEKLCLEALAVSEVHGDELLEAGCSISLGHAALIRDDAEAAFPWYERALTRCRDLGHTLGATAVLLHMGSYHKTLGHPERALPLYEECYAMGREVFHKRLLAICPLAIAEIEMQQGSLARALDLARLALENAWEASDLQCASEVLDTMAQAACMTGAYERALRLAGAAEGVHEMLGYVPTGDIRERHDATIREAREALGPEADHALEEGRAMGVGEAVAYALE
jgi:non-specific serine/threonine protein kinase